MAKVIRMAKIIEFYIPINFRKNDKWIPSQERGKIIEFSLPTKKSAGPRFSIFKGSISVLRRSGPPADSSDYDCARSCEEAPAYGAIP